jgi:hypothetical protein
MTGSTALFSPNMQIGQTIETAPKDKTLSAQERPVTEEAASSQPLPSFYNTEIVDRASRIAKMREAAQRTYGGLAKKVIPFRNRKHHLRTDIQQAHEKVRVSPKLHSP